MNELINKKRLFVAVLLPLDVQQEMHRIEQLLKKKNVCQGNYADPFKAHITLQFIGEVLEEQVAAIDAALQAIVYQKCQALVGSLSIFTKKGRIAIIYLDIISQALARLAQLVHQAVISWVQKEEHRSFVSHSTLLRVKKVKDEDALRAILIELAVQPISFTIDSFVLMQSELTLAGPIYTQLKRYELL